MYEFKQAVAINFKDKQGNPQVARFRQGVHPVSEHILATADFLHFCKCGWVAEVDPKAAPVPLETFSQRAERLAKKLAEKYLPKKETAPVTEPVQEPVQEPEAEDPGAEVPEENLTPAQKAARTRAANKAKAEAEKGK